MNSLHDMAFSGTPSLVRLRIYDSNHVTNFPFFDVPRMLTVFNFYFILFFSKCLFLFSVFFLSHAHLLFM